MASKIFDALLEEKISAFRGEFASTSRQVFVDAAGTLRHPGEFGLYREIIARNFLRFFIPGRIAIHNGFVITAEDDVSTQCDIIAYDAQSAPLIESGERQRFFPVESVCAVGEVKSVMSRADLHDALNKLSKVKALRERITVPTVLRRDIPGEFDPQHCVYDQIPTFLICEKFSFSCSNLASYINGIYDSTIAPRHRHNLVLSLSDGLLAYADHSGMNMMYPAISQFQNGVPSDTTVLKNRFIAASQDGSSGHIKSFCSDLFLMTSSATILYPEMARYMGRSNNTYHDAP